MVRPLLLLVSRRIFLWRRPIGIAEQTLYPLSLNKESVNVCKKCKQVQFSTSCSVERSFTQLSKALTSRKLEFSERKALPYPVELMYSIVEDVDRYSEFVPWVKKSVVIVDKGPVKQAKLEVGFKKVTEKYNSTVTCARPHLVKAVCTDGVLFNSLLCLWRFAPGRTNGTCVIDFQVSFEFRSLLYSQLANMVFNEIVKTMVNAFEKRACEVQNSEKQTIRNTVP